MTVNIIMNDKIWMEDNAIRQLEAITHYQGVTRVAGMPDLHGGRSPVGLTVASRGHIYPWLIGSDIGCGMGLYKTGLKLRKFKTDKCEVRLNQLRSMHALPKPDYFDEPYLMQKIGTIGGGNHFLEFQKLETIENTAAWAALQMDRDEVLMLVHTGSRDLGAQVLNAYNRDGGYSAEEPAAAAYLARHDEALLWARRNRFAAGANMLAYLGLGNTPHTVLDCHHNFVEKRGEEYIHRKGALSTEQGPLVIPGSRGTLTYLVRPTANTEASLWSVSHGAGRKWARSLCRGRLENKYDIHSIRRTALGSRVICHDREFLFQEAPEAYKNINDVIGVLLEHNLIEVIATLRPLLTYKG